MPVSKPLSLLAIWLPALAAGLLFPARNLLSVALGLAWAGSLTPATIGRMPLLALVHDTVGSTPRSVALTVAQSVIAAGLTAICCCWIRRSRASRARVFGLTWLAVTVSYAVAAMWCALTQSLWFSDPETLLVQIPALVALYILPGAVTGLVMGVVPALIALALVRPAPALPVPDAVPQQRSWLARTLGATGVAVLGILLSLAISVSPLAPSPWANTTAGALPTPTPTAPAGLAPTPNAAPTSPTPSGPDAGGTGAPAPPCRDEVGVRIGAIDAATGHRGSSLVLTNASSHSCSVEGYPLLTFASMRGTDLSVAVIHGGGFMANDPGSHLVSLAPGEQAHAVITWDAYSAHGVDTADKLTVTATPGIAPVTLAFDSGDIIDGATVAVTAWALPENIS